MNSLRVSTQSVHLPPPLCASRRNGSGVFISDIVKGGAADLDGRLTQGDQILAVNGEDVRGASQETVAAVLKVSVPLWGRDPGRRAPTCPPLLTRVPGSVLSCGGRPPSGLCGSWDPALLPGERSLGAYRGGSSTSQTEAAPATELCPRGLHLRGLHRRGIWV